MSDRQPSVIADRPGDGILVLRLNRPEKRNAVATELLMVIAKELDDAGQDDAIPCAVLTESERVFAAGADINE